MEGRLDELSKRLEASETDVDQRVAEAEATRRNLEAKMNALEQLIFPEQVIDLFFSFSLSFRFECF
jgi:hypothetical protein